MEDLLSSPIISFLCPGLCSDSVSLTPFPIVPVIATWNHFACSHPIYLNLWFNTENIRKADKICLDAVVPICSAILLLYLFVTLSLHYILYSSAKKPWVYIPRTSWMRWAQSNSSLALAQRVLSVPSVTQFLGPCDVWCTHTLPFSSPFLTLT